MSKYNRILFVDVELTCWEGEPPAGEQSEVIAFGLVDLKTDDLEIRREKMYFVRPQFSIISPFCSTLTRSEEHTSELQSQSNLVCRLLLEKKKKKQYISHNNYIQIISIVTNVSYGFFKSHDHHDV